MKASIKVLFGLGTLALVFTSIGNFTGCLTDGKSPQNSDDSASAGVHNCSPESTLVKQVAKKFNDDSGKIVMNLTYFHGSNEEFIAELSDLHSKNKGPDYIAFYSSQLPALIEKKWVAAYAGKINRAVFDPAALGLATSNGTIYGIPWYVRTDGEAKIIGACAFARFPKRTYDFIELLTSKENSQSVAKLAGGKSAYSETVTP